MREEAIMAYGEANSKVIVLLPGNAEGNPKRAWVEWDGPRRLQHRLQLTRGHDQPGEDGGQSIKG